MLSSFLWGSLLTWVTESRGARGGKWGDLTTPAEKEEPGDAAESALLLLLLWRPGFSPEPSSSVIVLAGSCHRPGQKTVCYLRLSDLFPWVLEFVLITPVVSRGCVDHTFSKLVLGLNILEVVEKTHKNACFSGVLNACPDVVWGDGSGLLGPM